MIKIAACTLLAFCAVSAQNSTPTAGFEVASVKPADPNARGSMVSFANDRLTATNITVKNYITMAYNVKQFQLEGGPSWIGNERYDIVAKLELNGEKLPTGAERSALMCAAVQALLAERFHLVVHRETKAMPAFAMVIAKSGFKLKASEAEGMGGSMSINAGKMTAQKISMQTLADNLAANLSSPVLDRTAIQGVFDLTLEWTPDETSTPGANSEPPAGPSIFTALQEQLGLKLETQKAPVEMIVIDRIERPTTN